MKNCLYLVLIIIFISCLKDGNKINIDENVQVYYYDNIYNSDNIIKIRINVAILDSNHNSDNFNKYFVYIDSGKIEKGKLTLQYDIIDKKYCKEIFEELYFPKYANINISNNKAKIKIINPTDFVVYNHENEEIGFLRFENYNCKLMGFGIFHSWPCSTISYIYATEETIITGKYDSFIFDLDLKKGWNMIYHYEGNIFSQFFLTTDSKNFPKEVVWKIIMTN